MKRIQAKKHKIGIDEIDEISLSCFDDKRFVLDDGVILQLIFIKIVIKNVIRVKKNNDNKKCDKNDNDNDNDNKNKNENENVSNKQYRY